MPLAQLVTAQRDFSAGQVDANLKRNEDHPAYKAGLRQCVNFRILATKGVENRFGRSAQYFDGPRVEQILMGPGYPFDLCFAPGQVQIRQNRVVVFTATGLPWTAATVGQIVWAILQTQIFITFPGMQPQVISWTINSTTFAIAPYAVLVNGTQKRSPFYRIAPHDITLQPSAAGPQGASITLTTSAPVFDPAMVGTYIQYIGRQILITAVADSTHATGTVEETLFPGYSLVVNGTNIGQIVVPGDVLVGEVSGAKLQVITVTGSSSLNVQSLNGIPPQSAAQDFLIGPAGSIGSMTGLTTVAPFAVTVWDQEVMNAYQGWPASCFADQQRLGLCNLPRVPSGVIWSAIGSPFDLYVPTEGLAPENAIFELAPGKVQVYFVVAGAESDEFVFCDNAVYWIPINVQNPLSATGAVVFNRIDEGCDRVQPRFLRGAIVYINAVAVRLIAATGAYNRPYEARDLSEYHYQLFNSVVAIACPDADSPLFPERYIYVLNGDGTLVVGMVDIENGQLKSEPGWTPWNGAGSVTWVAEHLSTVLFTVAYPGSTQGTLVEALDPLRYMDASITVNSAPAALAPPTGKGPLWWAPGHPVVLLDKGLRQMGVYQTDANGFIIPQFIGGEDLTSSQLVAGQMWTGALEPFIPSPGPGQDAKQRMVRRRVARLATYFNNSTGFLFVILYSGRTLPGGPAPGTVMGSRRIATYVMGDDPTQSAPLREWAEFWRPKGRSYDPRVAIIKDTVGPLTILEIGTEVTV